MWIKFIADLFENEANKKTIKKLTLFTNQLYTKFNLTNLVSKYYCNYYIKYMFYNLLITDISVIIYYSKQK